MKKTLKITGIALACLVGLVLLLVAALLLWLTIAEYKPAAVEPADAWQSGQAAGSPSPGDIVTILTLNTGYASLDKTQDFFMDGGTGVRPDTDANVRENLAALTQIVNGAGMDVVFLQEVDRLSKRSYFTDQLQSYRDAAYAGGAYAINYKVPYVPFPLPTIGKVEAGLVTLNSFAVAGEPERHALSDAYSWPVRLGQLKRCFLVERVPVAGSSRQLVLVNLHPEAYDDGEARQKQTAELFGFLEEEYEKGNYCIAGGDWNQTLPGVDEAKYPLLDDTGWTPNRVDASALPADWRFAADDAAPTCRLLNKPYSGDRAATQLYVIDGFLLSPNVELRSVQTLDYDFQSTDHNPVRLEVRLAED